MTEFERYIHEMSLEDHEYVISLRRKLHRQPELAREEFNTQRTIEAELDKLGICHRPTAGTGVYAELCGTLPCCGETHTLVLRADMDALPITEESGAEYASCISGVMHACGHDANTAALIGAARILSRCRDKFSGRVIFTWQPGEEIGYGARVIIDEGCIDSADRCFGVHLASDVPVGSVVLMPGPNNAGVDWFRVRIRGLASHVSAPELGVDAAYIASQIVVSAQGLVTRMTNPMDNVLLGIGCINAGTAYNIIAQEATLEGTVRTLLPDTRKTVKDSFDRLCRETARLYGGSAELEWRDNTSPLINDSMAAAEAQRVAASLFGEDKLIRQRRPSLSGDDFAEYILRCPGAYAYIGSANPALPNTLVPQHNSHYDIDEACLLTAVELMSSYAAEYLNKWL